MGTLRTVLPIALLVAVAACGADASRDPGDTELDAAGPVPEWSLSAEPLVRIGRVEGDPAYLFQRIRSVALLPDGGVAVGDLGSLTIRLFDARGGLVGQMGGPGEGPGELEWLRHLELLPPDTLVVHDPGSMRMTRFLTDGTLLSTATVRAEDGRPEMVLGRFSDGDWALAWISQTEIDDDPSTASADPMRLGRFAPDGTPVAMLGRATGLVRLGRGPVPFSPYLHGAVVGDSLYVTDGLEPSISVVDHEGEVVRSLEVEVPAPDRAAAWSALRTELEAEDDLDRLDDIPEAAEAEPVPHIARMLADDGGRLWLKHLEPTTDHYLGGGWAGRGPGGRWTVVDPGGAVTARIDLPADLVLMDVAHGRIAGVTRDELGVERVEVYALER